MRLCPRAIAMSTNSHGRLENIRAESSHGLIGLFQIVVEKGLRLSWIPQDREQVASLGLVLPGVRFVGVANPTHRLRIRDRCGLLCHDALPRSGHASV